MVEFMRENQFVTNQFDKQHKQKCLIKALYHQQAKPLGRTEHHLREWSGRRRMLWGS